MTPSHEGTILLGLLPYWAPLIPPLGISCLKGFLQQHGFRVRTVDFNTGVRFQELYHRYFSRLEGALPEGKRGNLYNIGHGVLQNHLMAHFLRDDESAYRELVRLLIRQNFCHEADALQVGRLVDIVRQFFELLEQEVLRVLEEVGPSVLGLSVFRGTLPASLFAFRLAKAHDPAIRTLMGGPIFSQEIEKNAPDFDAFLQHTPYIDHCLIGEGEMLLLRWLRGELPPQHRVYDSGSSGAAGFDLQTANLPDFSDFEVGLYPHLAAYGSRSCPFQCSFCAETLYWGKYRQKTPQQIAGELETLYSRHGRQLFLMCDSLLNPFVSDLAQQLARSQAALYWDGYLRVSPQAADVDQALKWRQGGFYRARLGIESGSARVLRLMGKKIGPHQIKEALSSLAHAGIKTTTYWVVGHPGETDGDFDQTLKLIELMKDDIYEAECNHFRYFPSGQVNSGEWGRQVRRLPLYPPWARHMLMLQSYTLDCLPTREETFRRVNRFVQHCRQLDIPNPYSLEEIYRADERWVQLHPNAVPPLVRLNGGEQHPDPGERRRVKRRLPGENIFQQEGDFDF